MPIVYLPQNIRETLLGEVHGTGSPHDKKVVSQVNEIYEPADKCKASCSVIEGERCNGYLYPRNTSLE